MATRKQRNDDDEDTKVEKKERVERDAEPRDQDEVVEVEVAGDDEEESDEEVAVESPEHRVTRADKKRQRGNEFKQAQERAAAAEAEAARLRAEREAERAQQLMQQQAYQQQQQGNQELDRLYQEQKDLYASFEAAQKNGLSDGQAQDFERRARDLEQRKYIAIARQNGAGQQVDPRQIQAMVEYNAIKAKYADIYSNEAALRWGDARLRQLAAEHGGQMTPDVVYQLLDQAAEDTRQRFGLGNRQRRPAPDAATRQRFSGVPARAGVNGGTRETVRMGRAEKKLAESLYPTMDPAKAWQKWANGPGRRAAAAAAQKDR